MAEPLELPGTVVDESEEIKTETADEGANNNPESTAAGGPSQSNTSLLKSQRKKMRMMSLMELLNEYMSSKNNKFKMFDCET